MPPEKSAVESFLSDSSDEKSPFKPDNADPFADTTVEDDAKGGEAEDTDEKPLPFHKDPKVQRYVEKQIAKALGSVKPSEVQPPSAGKEDDDADVLTRIIGNDTPEKVSAIKDFRKMLGSIEERGAQRALQEFQAQADKQKQQDVAAQEELDEAFEEIEETYSVDLSSNAPAARKVRSDFVDYVRKIAPKDKDGEVVSFPDMVAAFEEFQERGKRSPSNSKAKELAARGLSRSSDASTVQPTTGKSWKDVDKLFSRLS